MIIVIAHQKGGVGKSTLAVNLAVVMDTDLFDLDKQFSSVAFNYARVSNTKLPPINCYTLLEGDCQMECQTPIPMKDFGRFLVEYKGNSEKHIVVDCPGLDQTEVRETIFLADYLLTPVAPSPVEVYGLQNFEDILMETERAYNVEIRTHVLINNADRRSKRRMADLCDFVNENAGHFSLCKTMISRNMAFWDAFATGKCVTEYRPQGSSMEIKKLAHEIEDELRE